MSKKQQKPVDLRQVEKLLELAGTYAGDGAVYTAIDRAVEALTLLFQERDRRVELGMIPMTGRRDLLLLGKEDIQAVDNVIQYNWVEELDDYKDRVREEGTRSDSARSHVFHQLVRLDNLVQGRTRRAGDYIHK